MATINFMYRSIKEKANLHLRLLFRYDNKDFVFGANTQYEVSKVYWKTEHKKNTTDAEIISRQTEVNRELNKIRIHILKAFNQIHPTEVTKGWLNKQVALYYNPPQEEEEETIPTDLVNFIDYYIKEKKYQIKHRSVQKFITIKNKLQRFEEERNKTVLISDVNMKFQNEFVAYQEKEKYAKNTIQAEVKFIKMFCRYARKQGLETSSQLDDLGTDTAPTVKIYLSIDELKRIMKTNLQHDYLDNARDWLIISCYTGQRVSDFLRFNKEMIRIEDGEPYLEFTQKKTEKKMTLPIHKEVLKVLKKRDGEFPRKISDQRYNEYIKEVCKTAGLTNTIESSKRMTNEKGTRRVQGRFQKWELITSHIGRRSFATNFYGKIPTTYLIYLTGHSSESQFLAYLGKSNNDLAKEAGKYFKKYQ